MDIPAPRFDAVHDGRGYSSMTAAELLAAGVPQPAIDALLAGARLKAAKAECRRRIYAQASAETQMNMTAAVAAIGAKSAPSRTDEEKGVLAAQASALGWVDAMRSRAAEVAADPAGDPAADASWPAVPADAAALAARF